MKHCYDERFLILGSSATDPEFYADLAENFNSDMMDGAYYSLVGGPASNPNITKEYVESVKNDPEKEKKIYKRAIECVDKAEFIIVDISSASTGMGLEVGYLLSRYANEKHIVFIAKEGSKISPHIAGMYEHLTGKKLEVKFYKNSKDAIKGIESSQEYQNYSFERNY